MDSTANTGNCSKYYNLDDIISLVSSLFPPQICLMQMKIDRGFDVSSFVSQIFKSIENAESVVADKALLTKI